MASSRSRPPTAISAGRRMSGKPPSLLPLVGTPAGSLRFGGMRDAASVPEGVAALSCSRVCGRLIGEFVPSGVGSNGIQP